ncbi:MAG: SOS response-associated peptidase [Chloroflexi bacterium]|jgi:putative SOS response-associated peptidase YedK|nr:SOS response-associated peptidase [Chloroflexota bacterium]
MCGRYTLTLDSTQIQKTFPWLTVPEGVEPRYNIAPTQPVAVVPNDGRNRLDFFTWGLIPSWAKDPSIGNRLINARAETLTEKPSFRSAFRRRRCLVLADGFYEWRQIPGQKGKVPMYIQMKDRELFAFAGLWEHWNAPDGSHILSCTIITTSPNPLMEEIHNRMPVILPKEGYSLWLSPDEEDPQMLSELLRPYPHEEMMAYPVSTMVNSPANESPECIVPL